MKQLHILLLPLMAHGHTLPTIHMAKLFSSKGLKSTIITTSAFSTAVENVARDDDYVASIVIKFPPPESGLPNHISSLDQLASDDLINHTFKSLSLLEKPVEDILENLRPDCLVSDMFFPWTTDSAAKFGIPRVVFHGTSNFFLCASMAMRRRKPFNNVSSDDEPFIVPDLPHDIEFVRTQVPEYVVEEEINHRGSIFAELTPLVMDTDARSFGVLVNSFYELEPDYVDHYRQVLGRKSWNIGPLLLAREEEEEARARASREWYWAWLESKNPKSVVYVCFGSLGRFAQTQLRELAKGLEISGHNFIWVVRKLHKHNNNNNKNWVPEEGFVERTKNRGVIIRGWAPQVAILDHPSVGAFVTHCGWNSVVEGICSGVPMVTWPLFADQFYNEKLVTRVLRIGVSVGNKKWKQLGNDGGVAAEAVAAAVDAAVSEVEIRRRAEWYKEMARKAVGEGGSSWNDLECFLSQLTQLATPK
ncbi:scopoletin glucosyltransferase-like [Andrographis paniculata]|uniref:scopoletin glucosyltransferase-like n=1 Tax=Andrographis paniculata TaxID=175694 RepID=UPI0021E717A3|nr:scopoletin glucosyltransferase-like [Andrographis paniculata]